MYNNLITFCITAERKLEHQHTISQGNCSTFKQQGNEEGEIPKTTQLNLSILLVVDLREFKTL